MIRSVWLFVVGVAGVVAVILAVRGQVSEAIASLAAAVAVLSLGVSFQQRDAATAANVLVLAQILQNKDTQVARDNVMANVNPDARPELLLGNENAAALIREIRKVCSSYDVAATLLNNGLLPDNVRDSIVRSYSSSISGCWTRTRTFVRYWQREYNNKHFWEQFCRLGEEANRIDNEASVVEGTSLPGEDKGAT